MRPRKGELCSNDQRIDFTRPNTVSQPVGKPLSHCTVVCRDPAVTVRKGWRFGDATKGESLIVNTRHPLCQACADSWDDNEAEARFEAAAS